MDDTAVLSAYRGWLHKVAASLARPDQVEDLAQEGWIAMWRALRSYDPTRGSLPAWLTYKALNRMRDCILNEAWLGRPHRRLGRGRLADTTEYSTAGDDPVWDDLRAPEMFDSLAWAYHSGRIMAAINRLSLAQRRYVYLRFFRGYRHPDLIAAFGYDPHGLWTSPVNGARGKLATELADLRA